MWQVQLSLVSCRHHCRGKAGKQESSCNNVTTTKSWHKLLTMALVLLSEWSNWYGGGDEDIKPHPVTDTRSLF